jgi:diguanylate cyclase (GGDEF)-like protein
MNFHKAWQELTGSSFPLELELTEDNQEVQLAIDETKRIYQIRISPLIKMKNRKGLILIFTDITELKELQTKLEYQANYDGLTQIYNRRAFMENCEQDFIVAQKESIPFTVVLMDIDHFKKVNDTYGHHIGDQLLKHAVNIFRDQLTKEQIFARYGGEEFALSLNGYTALEAEFLGNRLRKSLAIQILQTSEGTIPVTFSMGVAEAIQDTQETVDQLLNKADKDLYSVKQSGHNQVKVYTEDRLEIS